MCCMVVVQHTESQHQQQLGVYYSKCYLLVYIRPSNKRVLMSVHARISVDFFAFTLPPTLSRAGRNASSTLRRSPDRISWHEEPFIVMIYVARSFHVVVMLSHAKYAVKLILKAPLGRLHDAKSMFKLFDLQKNAANSRS